MREPAPVRRLEVFTGTGRRRTWSAEQKARIVAESYESGETVSVVARRHALTAQQLFGWAKAIVLDLVNPIPPGRRLIGTAMLRADPLRRTAIRCCDALLARSEHGYEGA
jgi:transposase